MLVDAILNVFLLIPELIISLIPDISISIPDGILDGCKSLFGLLGYVFPVNKLMPILVISFTIKSAHIVWALAKKVYELIPLIN